MSSASLRSSSITPILALLALLLCNSHLSSQPNWERANTGLWGGELHVIAFAADGEPIAAVGRYLYRGEGFNDDNPSDVEWRRVLDIWDARQIERAGDGTLYVASDHIIFRSVDDGRSWEHVVNIEPTDIAAIDRARVLVREKHSRWLMEVSSDGAISHVDSTTTISDHFYNGGDGTIWRHPGSGIGIDFLETYHLDAHAFVGIPSPATFPGNRTVNDLLILRNGLRVAAADDGIKRSTDGGRNWERVSEVALAYLLPSDGMVMYGVGTADSPGLYRSDDGAATWDRCNLAIRGPAAVGRGDAILQGFEFLIEIATSCTDGWSPASRGLESAFVDDILEGADGTLWATAVSRIQSFGGWYTWQHRLYRSSDRGDTWRLVRDSINDLVGIDSTGALYVRIDSVGNGSTHPYFTVLRSRTGDEWEHVFRSASTFDYFFGGAVDPPPVRPIEFTAPDPKIVRISLTGAISGYSDCTSLISLDGGATFTCWRELLEDQFDTTRILPISAQFLEGGLGSLVYILAAVRVGDPGFEVTVDHAGYLFDPIFGTLVETGRPEEAETLSIRGRGATLVGYERVGRRIVVSTDTGRTWEERGLPESAARWWQTGLDVTMHGAILYAGVRDQDLATNRDRLKFDRLLVSYDNGTSWDSIGISRQNEIPVIGPSGILLDTIVGYTNGLPSPYTNRTVGYRRLAWSSSRRVLWSLAEGEAAYADVTAMVATRDETVLVGTQESGVLRTNGRLTDVPPVWTDPILAAPDHLTLLVSPNPLNGRSLVRLYTQFDSDVTLELYDLLGRRVVSIHDGALDMGMTPFVLDAVHLPWGPYLLYARDERGNREVMKVWVE